MISPLSLGQISSSAGWPHLYLSLFSAQIEKLQDSGSCFSEFGGGISLGLIGMWALPPPLYFHIPSTAATYSSY